MAYADQGNYALAQGPYPTLQKHDPTIPDAGDAERKLRDAVRDLRSTRFDCGRQAPCEP